MGPCRPIPCYLGEQKTSRGNVRGNTSDSVYTTSTGGKTPLGRAVLTPPESVYTFLAPSAIQAILATSVCCLYEAVCLSLAPSKSLLCV
ncbi:hypothetical protein K469DRAFT_23175 [Zopfia rhizophila CBS 207.26]|uniref:Uncharacterized protein n=1 Tax=Zopfia rhizophila CBS 207.26 TaxID=1314779 RepID=A0A6A6EJI8_9PEZI|nr:hypothetical protein K469DRAFT_23175 [Zopfia rhizophila CBS 207.26]